MGGQGEGGGFFLTRNEFGGGRDGSRGRTELGEGWGGRREERLTGPLPPPRRRSSRAGAIERGRTIAEEELQVVEREDNSYR